MRHGNYTLKELIPPEGFVLNTKVYNISITEDEQVIEVNATDRPIKGYIQVVKKMSIAVKPLLRQTQHLMSIRKTVQSSTL